MKWLKKHGLDLLLLVIVAVGFGLIAYPSFADYWNKLHQSRAISNYADAVSQIDSSTYDQLLVDAQDYNTALAEQGMKFGLSEEEQKAYKEVLDITGGGIMGYIEITKIGCYLPIYHGVEDAVLQVAVGHIEGTSLPIGGKTSHCVLSGHRGLPSAKLFTDLDKMEIGDKFVIRVLNETMTYEIDNIVIVEPEDMSALTMEEGKDYVTLVTCTPYGINSHRLLVRGHRVENDAISYGIQITSDALMIDNAIVAAFLAIPILLFLILLVFIRSGRRQRHNRRKEKIYGAEGIKKTEP